MKRRQPNARDTESKSTAFVCVTRIIVTPLEPLGNARITLLMLITFLVAAELFFGIYVGLLRDWFHDNHE